MGINFCEAVLGGIIGGIITWFGGWFASRELRDQADRLAKLNAVLARGMNQAGLTTFNLDEFENLTGLQWSEAVVDKANFKHSVAYELDHTPSKTPASPSADR